MKVAAVTMVYNEPDFLPIWLRHCSTQVGAAHCYIIDHGTDDGSTTGLAPANVIHIPRSPQDDDRRARFISGFCASLLEWYDAVLHTDVDEIVVADPDRHKNIASYCQAMPHDTITAYGFNIVHTNDDAPLDLASPILAQRRWMNFSAAFCKPALTRRPVTWQGGFHRADVAPVFDDLYMFHLRFIDRDIGLRRLARSRAQPWASPQAGLWQRQPDEDHLRLFARYDDRPRNAGIEIASTSPALGHAVAYTLGPSKGLPDRPDTFDMHFEVQQLWAIPARFKPIV